MNWLQLALSPGTNMTDYTAKEYIEKIMSPTFPLAHRLLLAERMIPDIATKL
jgi:hypothetical protein